jgi:hypothetical protein
MARTDLRKQAAGGGGGGGGVKPLDLRDPWDAVVLAEANLLQAWTGLKATLIHVTDGTAAGDGNVVCVDRAQLDGLFASFGAGTEKHKTAIFFALAHEFGHLCQFAVYGFDATFAMDSQQIEAHADYLSGVWLGMRLVQGEERLSEDVSHAALQLKGGPPDYPTEYQRACLVQDAMGTSVLLVHILEPQIKSAGGYQNLSAALNKRDVIDLFDTARRRLREIPEKP